MNESVCSACTHFWDDYSHASPCTWPGLCHLENGNGSQTLVTGNTIYSSRAHRLYRALCRLGAGPIGRWVALWLAARSYERPFGYACAEKTGKWAGS